MAKVTLNLTLFRKMSFQELHYIYIFFSGKLSGSPSWALEKGLHLTDEKRRGAKIFFFIHRSMVGVDSEMDQPIIILV